MLDGIGVQGSLLHYSLVIFFVLSALFIFLYLLLKGSLHMNEDPKFEMMKELDKQEEKDDSTGT
jgi:hypothetical protein